MKRPAIANPSALPACPVARKPVSKITDRAKRYRANQSGCKPAGVKRCMYCGSKKNVDVHHLDGHESNGRRSNLAWACRRCNTEIGLAMRDAGKGTRTRQSNPSTVPSFAQYAWAVGMICRRRDEKKGLCSRSSDPLVKEAVEVIRATPASTRRSYAAQAASVRGARSRGRDEVPF